MSTIYNESISVFTGYNVITGHLSMPSNINAFVIFANENNSSIIKRRNQIITNHFAKMNIGTCMLDLLSPDEEKNYYTRFNIPLLAERLRNVTISLIEHPLCKNLLFGYFGSGIVSAAALMAAFDLPEIKSIVSWRGRPDLATKYLPLINAPTLFIVGNFDLDIFEINEQAFNLLNCKKSIEKLTGASYFLHEKKSTELVSEKAGQWFNMHLHPMMINVN